MALLALAATASSLANGFAFDDVRIIASDPRVHHLAEPWRFFTQPYWPYGGLYRPLTSLAYAMEWQIGRGAPWPFHAANVLLYLIVCVAVFRLAALVLGPTAGWWVAALFAVHPVHAEAVANSVGQAELWAALLIVLALAHYVRARRSGALAPRDRALLIVLYAAACLFKEHALMLPLLFLAAELTVLGLPLREGLKRPDLRALAAGLALVGLAFWGAHVHVAGSFAGDRPTPALNHLSFAGRAITMLSVVPEWLRLLFIPTHFRIDYMPQELPRANTLGWRQLGGLMLLAASALLALRARRSQPALTWAAAWLAITLFPVSNLVVVSGVFVAERTLFLPSVGAALAVGAGARWAASWNAAWRRRHLAYALGVTLLCAGALVSAQRQRIWRDNKALSEATQRSAPNSYRTHWSRAARSYAARRLDASTTEYQQAIALFPYDPGLLLEAAGRMASTGRCDLAVQFYRQSFELVVPNFLVRQRLIRCLMALERLDEAQAETATALARGDPAAPGLLAAIDSARAARFARDSR